MSNRFAQGWVGRVVACAALVAAVSCDGASGSGLDPASSAGDPRPIAAPVDSYGVVNKINQSLHAIPFLGTRVYRLEGGAPDGTAALEYREQVASDGGGQFSIEVLDLIQPVLSPSEEALQLQLLSSRGRLLYRYRGFAIRDVALFLGNYTLVDLGSSVTVAGVAASEFSAVPNDPADHRWALAVDVATGIVLRAVETDATGAPVSTTEFESIDYAPDLSGVAWNQAVLDEEILTGVEPLPFQFDVLSPVLVPSGYQEVELSQLVEPVSGEAWAKRTFSNGVDALFFLQTDEKAPLEDLAEPYAAPQVGSYRVGAWQVLDGVVAGQRVVLMGKVSEWDLAQMLQSSL